MNRSRSTITRRTSPAEDEAPTRRTSPPVPAAGLQRPERPPQPLTRRERQIRLFAGALLAIILTVIVYNEYAVWRAGSTLRHEIEAERLTDMEQAWTRYLYSARDERAKLEYLAARLTGSA